MGAHYRHTTPEMAARVVTAIQARLTVVVHAAENPPVTLRVPTAMDRGFWQIPGKWQFGAFGACKRPGAEPGLSCWFGVEPRRNRTGDPILTIRAAGYLQ
jgi:hypothetical protein